MRSSPDIYVSTGVSQVDTRQVGKCSLFLVLKHYYTSRVVKPYTTGPVVLHICLNIDDTMLLFVSLRASIL